jgi:hypothetical protein
LVGAHAFRISYTGGNGNDVTLTALTGLTPIFTWDGGGTDHNWSTPANWVGDAAPTPGSNLVFNTSTPGVARFTNTNDFADGFAVGSITIRDDSPTVNFTLNGSAIVLLGNLTVLGTAVSSTVAFSQLTLGADLSITPNTGASSL